MKAAVFKKKFEGQATQGTFFNEQGEKFEVYRINGPFPVVFLAGDETEWEVKSLFCPDFAIWSVEELRQLGEALVNITEEQK